MFVFFVTFWLFEISGSEGRIFLGGDVEGINFLIKEQVHHELTMQLVWIEQCVKQSFFDYPYCVSDTCPVSQILEIILQY